MSKCIEDNESQFSHCWRKKDPQVGISGQKEDCDKKNLTVSQKDEPTSRKGAGVEVPIISDLRNDWIL